MLIAKKQYKKIINYSIYNFSSTTIHNIIFDNQKLSEKYYNPKFVVNNISENLKEEFPTVKDLVDNKNYKKEIFSTEEKEKAFIDDKSKKFNLPRKLYQHFLEKGMLGDAIQLKHNNIELYIIGTVYERINSINLYKLLNYVKPDLIVLQMRPDRLLTNIDNYYNKDPSMLIKKLIRDSSEIQPSSELKDKTKRILLNKGFLVSSEKTMSQEITSSYKTIVSSQCERLSNEALSTISIWGEQKDTKILLADLPEGILIEKLANTLSLIQIQLIFEETFTQFPNNPDWEPRTSLGTAINLYPDLFVNPSDSFLAQIIDHLSKTTDNKPIKAVSFVGYGQTISLPFYLNYDLERNSIQNILTVPARYTGFIASEDSLEVMAEKWCLLSLIVYGLNTEINSALINHLIKKYSRDEMIKTGFNSENHLMNRTAHLFNELMISKTELAQQFIGKGYEIKKKMFMRKIFNDPLLNSQLL
jgi:hypothetical protein